MAGQMSPWIGNIIFVLGFGASIVIRTRQPLRYRQMTMLAA
jgi:hypothetical protein